MQTKSETGKTGENAVVQYLINHGYNVLFRNYRIKGGEIDIIAENGEYIIFVEVKTRKPKSLVTGFDAITERKKSLIIKTACDWCSKYPTKFQPRFDVASVIADDGKVISIDYIKNAFDTTGYNFIF